MRFQVKVGQDFPCFVAEDQPPSVAVTINNSQAAPTSPPPGKSRHSPLGYTLIFAAALFAALVAVLAPLAWWAATGDTTYLKSIAQVGGDLLKLGVELLKPS
jgi:hypothetical protein